MFQMEAVYTVRTTGNPGTGVGQIMLIAATNGAAPCAIYPIAGITGTSSIDTTTSGAVDLQAQWGAAGATTGFTIHTLQMFLEA
jgi:hypothetical protein